MFTLRRIRINFLILVIILTDVIYIRANRIVKYLGPSYCIQAPKVCPNENIIYYLYTSQDPTTPVRMSVSEPESIKNAKFVPGPVKFIIHGFVGDKDDSPNKEIRPAYFEKPRDINVISIDYGPLAQKWCYFHAVENADVIANCTAQFLESLLTIRDDIQLPQIHFIGLSLGAHISGQIIHYFTLGEIERITALDAAFPLYYGILTEDDKQINKGDAKFIDAIHTNAGIKGKLWPFADVDFYANGGINQPPCGRNTTCAHIIASDYFAESINSPKGFWGRCCSFHTYFLGYCSGDENWQLFGEYVDTKARGTYFFKTTDKPPYALGVGKDF